MKYFVILTTFLTCLVLANPSHSLSLFGPRFERAIDSLLSIFRKDVTVLQETKKVPPDHPSFARKIDRIIAKQAHLNRLDPNLVHAIIRHESNYQPHAVSNRGAVGLMQLMPGTAREMNVKNIRDPEDNIAGGTRYYRLLLNQFGNHWLALVAYNCGPGNVSRGIIYKESEIYAQRVINTWSKLQAQNIYK